MLCMLIKIYLEIKTDATELLEVIKDNKSSEYNKSHY